jgi:hypothetical protein
VLCLCCGSYYGPVEDCPNWALETHSAAQAARVARYLLERGCEHPRPLDVRTAVAALEAFARG